MTARQAKRLSVLVVENDATVRALVARLLRSFGIGRITQAADGQQAVELLHDAVVDLIVTDFQMPRLDGIDLTRALRRRGDDTPVIMLSGQDDPRLIARAKRAGVSEYLIKPLNATTVADLIERTLFTAARTSGRPSSMTLPAAKPKRRRSA